MPVAIAAAGASRGTRPSARITHDGTRPLISTPTKLSSVMITLPPIAKSKSVEIVTAIANMAVTDRAMMTALVPTPSARVVRARCARSPIRLVGAAAATVSSAICAAM